MTATPPGPPLVPESCGPEEFRGDAAAPAKVGNRADGSNSATGGGPTSVRAAGNGDRPRNGRAHRCRCAQSRLPGRALSVQQGLLKVVLSAGLACRWDRPFAFGEQGGDWFWVTGRTDRYLDDLRNWPNAADCPAKIRETAANPRPQDQDAHFWSLN